MSKTAFKPVLSWGIFQGQAMKLEMVLLILAGILCLH